MMTEFLHEVIKKREREQEHRTLMPRNYLDELMRQTEESYNRMATQAINAAQATYATYPNRVTEGLTTIHGMIAVRSRSVSGVDAYIRANIERHDYNLSRETTQHSHDDDNMQWVLEEVSSARFMAGLGRALFTYRCSLCGQAATCSESVPREAVINARVTV